MKLQKYSQYTDFRMHSMNKTSKLASNGLLKMDCTLDKLLRCGCWNVLKYSMGVKGAGTLLEAREERVGRGIPKVTGMGRNRGKFSDIVKYFVIE